MDGRATWSQHLVSSDIEQLAAGQGGWRLRYEQLSAGAYRGELHLVQLPAARLVLECGSCALRQRGQIGADCYGFALALEGTAGVHFAGRRVTTDTLMMGRGDDIDLCLPPGFAFIAMVVERPLLAALWPQLYGKPLAPWLEHPVAAVAEPQRAAALRRLHLSSLQQLAALPALLDDAAALTRLRDTLLVEWIEAIPAAVDGRAHLALAGRRRLVERACERMRALPEQPLSLAELAHQVGASPRKLGYCFADVLGTSPARYQRLLRLDAVRAALRRCGAGAERPASVQDVAARLGFWHLGQFAHDYRRHFGELPSQTLRAAQRARVSF